MPNISHDLTSQNLTILDNNNLYLEIAHKYKTPCYVYDKNIIINNYLDYKQSFENNIKSKNINYLICYAVKANSNLAILNTIYNIDKNNTGFDIVSIGELERVYKATGNTNNIVFSGVGKQDFEIKRALEAKIYCFNIESEPELLLINKIAKDLNINAPVSIRVNPNVDANSHPYISTGLKEHKFGIDINYAAEIYNLAKDLEHINILGVDCHIGSQLTDLKPLEQACVSINNFINNLRQNNIELSHINMGGGLGINYNTDPKENIPSKYDWIKTIANNLKINANQKLIIEPGRSITGNAGVLLTKVIYNKIDRHHKLHNFTIVDAAMTELLRPALYHAKHNIINLSNNNNNNNNNIVTTTSIVGPVCESSDVFLKNINFNSNSGDILAILDVGAYGYTMASSYNSRPKCPEILIYNNKDYLIKPRETIEELYHNEIILH